MQILVWLVRVFVFFALFAFALNNQHDASVHWFFGRNWSAPMVFIVLAAFALGCAFGIFAMVPSWWRHRRMAIRRPADVPPTEAAVRAPATPDSQNDHPPRDGL
jgi:uncharacterized integral membrane protein